MASLFPAYSSGKPAEDPPEIPSESPLDWLQNASYTARNEDALSSIRNATLLRTQDLETSKKTRGEPQQSDAVGLPVSREPAKSSDTKRKKKKRSRSASRAGSPQDPPETQPPLEVHSKRVFIEDVGIRPEHAFRIDRKPDRNNLAFSSFAHQHVAKYVRLLPCIGCSHEVSSWLSQNSTKGKKKQKKKANDRYHRSLKIIYDENNILDLSEPTSKSGNRNQELLNTLKYLYVPIELPSAGSRESADGNENRTPTNPLGVYDPATSLYLEGKGTDSTRSKEEGAKEDRPPKVYGVYRETSEQYVARMTAHYNKYLRENPHDVKEWLRFAKFQTDAMSVNQFANSDRHQKVTDSVLLEKQMAILDKAIESNPKSVELLVYKNNLCSGIWDTEKLMKAWKNVMFVHPNNTWLWKRYLLFFQTRFSSFTTTKFAGLYKKCFAMLKKIHDGSFQSHKPLPRMEENMLDIFSKYCNVLYQTGYHERAIANFQALIEFNFFAPQHLSRSAPLEDWLAFFEPFWDSNLPRFGEKDALGWCSAMKDKEIALTTTPSAANNSEEDVIQPSLSKWQNWVNLERFRENRHWLPWKPTELEDECEDPDRMVLFDDVSQSLFHLEDDDCKFLLLVRFLSMLGLQVDPHLESTCEILGCHDPGYITESREVLDKPRHFHWKFYSAERSSQIFSLDPLFDPSPAFHEFVTRVFQQSMSLIRGVHKDTMIRLWVRHLCSLLRQHRNNPQTFKTRLKDTKKTIKSLLKLEENRNNLALWTEYAKLEGQCQNLDESRKIFDLALTTFFQTYGPWSKMTGHQRASSCNVFKIYASLELGYGTNSTAIGGDVPEAKRRALAILARLGNDEKYAPLSKSGTEMSPALILKAKVRYKTLFEALLKSYGDEEALGAQNQLLESLNGVENNLFIDWTVCYALFEYLTDGLRAASSIFETALQPFNNFAGPVSEDMGTTELRNWTYSEVLHMHYVELHVLHNNVTASTPLSVLRGVLSNALESFPNNWHLNHLFLDIEAKSHIAMRVRKQYDNQLKDNTVRRCETAIFAVVSELERQKNLMDSVAQASQMDFYDAAPLPAETGITHRLRALFEKIVRHHNLRNCVLIWRLYMKYEMMRSGAKDAKAIFYRALQHCPWAKVLYLDAIQYFPEDIQEINDILVEKEIRMRVPLEEIDLLMETNEKLDTEVQNSETVLETP